MNSMQSERIQNPQIETEQTQNTQPELIPEEKTPAGPIPVQSVKTSSEKPAGTSSDSAEFHYQLRTTPGCRFRHCNAKLTMREGGSSLYLIAELPIFINRSEYAGVGAELAKLNGLMDCEWYNVGKDFEDSDISGFSFQEGFILDVIEGTIRYEISVRDHTPAPDDPGRWAKLRRFAEYVADRSICDWSESILRMVSNESINLEREEHRRRLRAAQQRPKTFSERIMDFLGLDSVLNTNVSGDDDSVDDSDDSYSDR